MTLIRKSILAGLILLLCTSALGAVPQLAVLEAILAPGTDPTVAGPVTDRIIEELLNSGRYTVLDRANTERILTEKEFQLSSGIVGNEEVRQAGEYLGADLVAVANVSRVGSTYVISARIIDVVTGQIVAQASAEKQGKIDVLLEIARTVGKQISGQEISVPQPVVEKATEKLEEEKQPAAAAQPIPSGNTMAMASLQELIRKRTHVKRGGQMQMAPFVAAINDQERMLLYSTNRRDDAMTGFLLNLVIPWACVGSWIQRDVRGALVSYALTLGTAVTVGGGVAEEDEDVTTIGLVMGGVTIAYYLLRPFRYVKLWNRNLANSLNVPYLSILDAQDHTFGVIRSESGSDWYLGLNLVSIGY